MWLALINAWAGTIVWIGDVSPATQERVRGLDTTGMAEKTPGELRGEDLSAYDSAYQDLVRTVDESREFETKLDGEKRIMADIEAAMESIAVIRGQADSDVLFKARVYQGFAVSRFFDVDLGGDPDAAPWRVQLLDGPVVSAWRDAVALQPDRDVTPYEIAEAPQRRAFKEERARMRNGIPGAVRVKDVPKAAEVFVDGKRVDGSKNSRVMAGTHYIHILVDGRMQEHWITDVAAGDTAVLSVQLTDEVWDGFLSAGTSNPALEDVFERAGGEVWLVRETEEGASLLVVTPDGAEQREIPKPADAVDESRGPLSAAGYLELGWLSTGDYYLQDPVNVERTRASVNTAIVSAGVAGSVDLGLFRFSLGAELGFTPGHVAYTGSTKTPLRVTPYAAVGIKYVQVVVGYTFPYHPVVGGRAVVPITDLFELRASGRVGLGGEMSRADGSTYQRQPLYTLRGGVGVRFQ